MTRAEWHGLEITCPGVLRDRVLAALSDFDFTGVEEDPEHADRMIAFASTPWDPDGVREAVASLSPGVVPVLELRAFAIADEDWLRVWKADWKPTPLGRRLLVVPAWWEGPLDPTRVAVRIEPGRAFGTGTHATTSIAWELLEQVLGADAPPMFLDVGAGSALLGLGALALLPNLWVIGTEGDDQAIPSLRANLELNRSGDRLLAVFALGIPVRSGSMPLIVANLTAAEHHAVEAEVGRALAPGGRLVVSGFLEEQMAGALTRFEGMGYRMRRAVVRDGWGGYVLQR